MLDTPETIDPRSLQHQGSYALPLVQRFGNQDLSAAGISGGIELQISDQTWELTTDVLDALDKPIRPRTEDMMPMINFDYGTVVVRRLSP